MWVRKGDKVRVIAGNDKGVIGEVMCRKGDRVLVRGVNVRKKHLKKQTQEGRAEIIEIERPIHISNVTLCDADGSRIKLKVKTTESGSKELFYIGKGGDEINYRNLRK